MIEVNPIIVFFIAMMHCTEAFGDRFIIRGIFTPEQSKAWHRFDVWHWLSIYTLVFVAYTRGVESFPWIDLLYMAFAAVVFRFTAMTLLLNQLLIEDGQHWREWYSLTDTGVDQWVVDRFEWMVRKVTKKDAIGYDMDTMDEIAIHNPFRVERQAEKAIGYTSMILSIITLIAPVYFRYA